MSKAKPRSGTREPKLTIHQHVDIAKRIKQMELETRDLASIINQAYGDKHEAVKEFGAMNPHLWRARMVIESNFYREWEAEGQQAVYTGYLGKEEEWLAAVTQDESTP